MNRIFFVNNRESENIKSVHIIDEHKDDIAYKKWPNVDKYQDVTCRRISKLSVRLYCITAQSTDITIPFIVNVLNASRLKSY